MIPLKEVTECLIPFPGNNVIDRKPPVPVATEAPPKTLPGKKAYIPPYTPKSAIKSAQGSTPNRQR